jgi:hypothetical protein
MNDRSKSLIVDEFAAERSHNDADAANEIGKASAQAALVLNGGAGTAVLAYISKGPVDPAVLYLAPFSLLIYGAGVILAALMLNNMSKALDIWNLRWREAAYGRTSEQDLGDGDAHRIWRHALNQFLWSLGCFITASLVIATALVVSKLCQT